MEPHKVVRFTLISSNKKVIIK